MCKAKVQGKYGLKRFTRQRYVNIFINDPEKEQEYFLFTCDFSVMCQKYNGWVTPIVLYLLANVLEYVYNLCLAIKSSQVPYCILIDVEDLGSFLGYIY